MAYTQSDLDASERAIARGESTVQFGDRMVVYRSMTDLLRAKNEIVAALSARTKTSIGTGSKGL